MFTSTRIPARAIATRRLPLFVACGALLAACVAAGVAAQRGMAGSHGAHAAQSADTLRPAGGNLSQAATRGGVAEALPYRPASVAPAALQAIPRGGYAEWLDGQQATAAGSSVQPIPHGGYADFLHDHPATAGAVASRPLGGVAEWLLWRSEAGAPAAP